MSDTTVSQFPALAPGHDRAPEPPPGSAARTFRDAVIGGVVTILGGLLLSSLTGAWSGKETAEDHRASVAAVRAEHAADIQRVEGKLDRVLDLLCASQPTARQCRP